MPAPRPATGSAGPARPRPPAWWWHALTSDERVAATAEPGWAVAVDRALRHGATPTDPGRAAGSQSWQDGFGRVLAPFVDDAAHRLHEATRPDPHVDPAPLADGFRAALATTLVRAAGRTLVLELNVRRVEQRLRGDDGAARFDDFVQAMTQGSELADLVAVHPVLGRLVGQACLDAVAARVELLHRFRQDRSRLVAELLDGRDPGRLTDLRPGLGDPHHGGRTVSLLTFADGRKVVYKPRSLDGETTLGTALRTLAAVLPDPRLRAVRLVPADGYGWTEFVAARPLPEPAAAERFYRRTGVLLALLHVLRATDVHHGNLVADGEHPVVVDAETVLQPSTPAGPDPDPAARALAVSVARTGLLPRTDGGWRDGADTSGLGGGSSTGRPIRSTRWQAAGTDEMHLAVSRVELPPGGNRPTTPAGVLEAADHAEAIRDGFRAGYDAISRHRDRFADVVRAAASARLRPVYRATQEYTTILQEATHPQLLCHADQRDAFLCGRLAAGPPVDGRLLAHEMRDLWRGDVPRFGAAPDRPDVVGSDGTRVVGVHPRSATEDALEVLGGLGSVDRADQEWLVLASLAMRRPAGPRSAAAWPGRTAPPVGTESLLAAGCTVADRLLAEAVTAGDRLGWLGLQLSPDGRWAVQPLGIDLEQGRVGVALFLAELGHATGAARYRAAATAALAGVPAQLDRLRDHPGPARSAGAGGHAGLGGVARALARLATLLEDPVLRTAAQTVATSCAAAGDDGPAGTVNPAGDVRALTEGPPLTDLSLGSGECRVLETLLVARDATGRGRAGADRTAGPVAAALARRAGVAVQRIGDGHLVCAAPDGVLTPGLLTGLAGIGHTMLRLALPRQVPSALLLRPPTPGPTGSGSDRAVSSTS